MGNARYITHRQPSVDQSKLTVEARETISRPDDDRSVIGGGIYNMLSPQVQRSLEFLSPKSPANSELFNSTQPAPAYLALRPTYEGGSVDPSIDSLEQNVKLLKEKAIRVVGIEARVQVLINKFIDLAAEIQSSRDPHGIRVKANELSNLKISTERIAYKNKGAIQLLVLMQKILVSATERAALVETNPSAFASVPIKLTANQGPVKKLREEDISKEDRLGFFEEAVRLKSLLPSEHAGKAILIRDLFEECIEAGVEKCSWSRFIQEKLGF
jgi:hypothetical protein